MTISELFAARYRILRTLGSGGMGVVYLAEDTRNGNREVALKTIRAEADGDAAESFRAEFLHVQGVVHPHIPAVFDFGRLPEGGYYFTSEFVRGRPLDEHESAWTPEQLQEILVALCRALAFLHSRGILHRDIKPQNVLGEVGAEGNVATIKLVDFGLAVTRGTSGEISGTLDYLAPEIITGDDATAVSDLYSLGLLLFRLATGRMPLTGDDPVAAARQRCTQDAPPAMRFRPDLPVGLSDVIEALIRVKPDDRPPSARHVIALLNERQGTEYPFETTETRSAYIRSAVSVAHRELRDELHRAGCAWTRGEAVENILVLGPRGLGRRRLLREFSVELGMEGRPVCCVESERDLEHARAGQALIVPDVFRVNQAGLKAAIYGARERGNWIVLGGAAIPDEIAAMLEPGRTFVLAPLRAEEIPDFLTAMFPENIFPEEFAVELHRQTMGFTAALEAGLKSLLEAEQLRIGLSGWELLPGAWRLPEHEAIAEHVQAALAELSPCERRVAQAISGSADPLPRDVLRAMCADAEEPLDAAISELHHAGWLEESDKGYSLRYCAVAEPLERRLSREERQLSHRALAKAWENVVTADDRRGAREILFHRIHAADWNIAPEKLRETLRAALEAGNLSWVSRVAARGLELDPPPELRDALEDAAIEIEFKRGHLQAAAERLGELVRCGEVEVSEKSLERLARYASLEEKLGRGEHARAILETCLSVLPEGYDQRAGLVFGTLAWIAFKQGDADTARDIAERGLLRIPPDAADAGNALLLNTVATLAFYRGELDTAELFWKRSLEVYESLGDRAGIASLYNSLGAIAAQRGDRLQARNLWRQCADLARAMQDVHRLAGVYNNLGIDALETGQLAEAEDYYRKALGLFRRMKNPRAQVEILSNLGELAYYRADYPRAEAYLREAAALAAMQSDHESEIEPLLHLGRVLLALDELDGAWDALTRASETANDVGAKKTEAQTWEAIAQLRARQGDVSAARHALERASALLSEEMDPLARLHFHLTECATVAQFGEPEGAQSALAAAHKVAKSKWDPFAAARSLVYGLLFAHEEFDPKERSRALRQLAVYPDYLWRFHWASARRLAAEGSVRTALDEFGRGAAVLKGIAARLSEEGRKRYLDSPHIREFRAEAVALKNQLRSS